MPIPKPVPNWTPRIGQASVIRSLTNPTPQPAPRRVVDRDDEIAVARKIRKHAVSRGAKSHLAELVFRTAVWLRDGGRCRYCGMPLVIDAPWWAANLHTLDHVIPISRGGQHRYDNIVSACPGCNNDKGALTDWYGLAVLNNGSS